MRNNEFNSRGLSTCTYERFTMSDVVLQTFQIDAGISSYLPIVLPSDIVHLCPAQFIKLCPPVFMSKRLVYVLFT